jgi:benzoyl-CoA reductase/2-hydroxyglutaryl-CoA dehydratase subunit BcrC/BadD/HgdB
MLNPIGGDGRARLEGLKIAALRRLMCSRLGLRLARLALTRGVIYKLPDRVSSDFFLELAQRAYADRSAPVVWTNIFLPCELMWGLGLTPFYPETWASLAAALGLTYLGLERAETLGYPVDLCTVHRAAAGLSAARLYPRADAYIATSNTCDATSQILAGYACAKDRPFFFVDVPQSEDEEAVNYVADQLHDLVEDLTGRLGLSFELERLRQAIRLSNQARVLALEVAALRETNPAPLRGSAMLDQLGMLTSILGHPSGVTYYRALRDYTADRIQRAEPEQANQKARMYWMHLKPFYPTTLLSHLEDDLGAVIAAEEASGIWWDELDEQQPLRSLARKILANYFNGPVERRMRLALRQIARYQCVGAIHFSHWGCRQSSGALHVLRRRLRKEGVPLLVLDGDCVDPTNLQLGPLRTRVEAFFEMLA